MGEKKKLMVCLDLEFLNKGKVIRMGAKHWVEEGRKKINVVYSSTEKMEGAIKNRKKIRNNKSFVISKRASFLGCFFC